jgi:hypothetical protein
MRARTIGLRFNCILLMLLVGISVGWQKSDKLPATSSKPESFWDKVLRYAGISHDASNLKAPGDEVISGGIWISDLTAGAAKKVSSSGGYRSPIFVPGRNVILALNGANVVEVDPASQKGVIRYATPSISKLVGFSLDNPDSILVLLDKGGGRPAPGLLSMSSGKINQLSYDPTSSRDLEMIEQLQSWERTYGNTSVYTKRQSKETLYGSAEWTDVYLKQDAKPPVDVSNCDGVNCGQPSLSADGRTVVFIRSDRN